MTIELLRNVLGWCAIINVGLLFLCFLLFRLAHDWIYRFHGKWFHLSVEKFDMIWYAMLTFFKTCIFLFNIVPYVALHIAG
ncbi:MAG: hypothetical protein K8S55_01600 [Phycisphaerae bacterium]|nr:hypothetical protein [Phycisphaerae bacterium]